MKVSGKGVLVILLFLILIPVIIDLILSLVLPASNFILSRSLSKSYVRALPFYFLYLIIAFAVLYLWKTWRQNKKKTE